MESIYKLTGRAAEVAARYDEIQSEFEDLMEENGGELDDQSQELIDKMAELEAIQEQIQQDILSYPDEYAAWYLNVKAEKEAEQARLDAYKKEQKKALAKYESNVRRLDARMEWIKESIGVAMDVAEVAKFDKKSRPGSLHTLYFQNRDSIEVNEALALREYQDRIDCFIANLPEWLSVEPKIKKDTLRKAEVLPQGFERKTSRSLVIK